MKYIAVFGEYNRCFGESPHWREPLKATTLKDAKVEARQILRGHNPDAFLVELREVKD